MTCVAGGTCCCVLVLVTVVVQYAHSANFNVERLKRQSCSAIQFQCDSGQCIDQFAVCDGSRDCQDGSDETSKTCQNFGCPQYAFRCAYGACANAGARCNKVEDCADGSDEKGCPSGSNACKNNQFQCKSGTCIDVFLMCDGTKDCDDGTDETVEECGSFACPSHAFRCDYGACIDRVGVCNGVKQCADGSDEKPEKCGTPITTPKPTPTPPPSAGCKLPPQPENGQYKLGGCSTPCQPVPGDTVHNSSLTYTCNPGFLLSGSAKLVCKGRWSGAFPSCSRATCPALVNPSRDIECKLDDRKVDCDQPMAPGTKAVVKCNFFYKPDRELDYFDIVCESNGEWSQEVRSCIPKCGEPNPSGVAFVAGGTEAKYGEFPWHAGIYRLIGGSYKQICGGSIVSERVIITAAHCFWSDDLAEALDTKDFKIAVGKFYRDWNRTDERHVQLPEIDKIVLHERFRGKAINWINDIALVKLKIILQMTIAVRPICMDLTKDNEKKLLLSGKTGIVMGWGITELQTPSEKIHKAILPYVPFEVCEKEVPPTFLVFLTNDKFCAGYRNGTSVCTGDSGGGYGTQFRDGKWYLMGLVSVGVASYNDACDTFHYTTFTRVSEFYSFIQENK